jgi:hypothetical protein
MYDKKIIDKKELKKFVYSIRITSEQRDLIKNNECIKKELDRMVINYINIYLKDLIVK